MRASAHLSEPALDHGLEAIADARSGEREGQAVWKRPFDKELAQPSLQPTLTVLEGKLKDIAARALNAAERSAAHCDRDGYLEGQVRLALLRRRREDRLALDNHAGHDLA